MQQLVKVEMNVVEIGADVVETIVVAVAVVIIVVVVRVAIAVANTAAPPDWHPGSEFRAAGEARRR